MKEEAGIQALFFMDLNSKHLRGTTILLTSYWLTYCPCLTFKGVEFITSASNTVLFLAQDGVTYLGFFSLLYLLQGGYLLEMISMTSARALCFINVRVRVSCHLIWEHSYFLNYSFVNNSCISSYVPMSQKFPLAYIQIIFFFLNKKIDYTTYVVIQFCHICSFSFFLTNE